MLYLDTSFVVALLAPEAHSAKALRWLEAQAPGEVAISDWVVTEASSALSLKQRTGDLDEAGRARGDRAFKRLTSEVFEVLPVPRAAFAAAATMSSRWQVGLRAGDALHVAIAAEHQRVLCTRDARQADAAHRLGLETVLLFAGDPS